MKAALLKKHFPLLLVEKINQKLSGTVHTVYDVSLIIYLQLKCQLHNHVKNTLFVKLKGFVIHAELRSKRLKIFLTGERLEAKEHILVDQQVIGVYLRLQGKTITLGLFYSLITENLYPQICIHFYSLIMFNHEVIFKQNNTNSLPSQKQ